MSIVPLLRFALAGLVSDKSATIDALQTLGCTHVESLGRSQADEAGAPPNAKRALRFIASAPTRRHQAHDRSGFDAQVVERRALAIEERLKALSEQRRFLRRRIRDLSPWGDFGLPDSALQPELRLWFYVLPLYLLRRMPRADLAWHLVQRDHRYAHVVVIARDEPHGLPVERTHTGSLPLRRLEQQLEEVEIEEDQLQAERVALSRWLDLFAANVAQLEDQAAASTVARRTRDDGALFLVEGWVPQASAPNLRDLALRCSCAVLLAPPGPGDDPPTLLANSSFAAGGQALLSIYSTPGYRTWDPSMVLVGSFALFFGLILADAGYGLTLAALTAVFWRRMGRKPARQPLRHVLVLLGAAACVAGLLSGTCFGVDVSHVAPLDAMRVIDLADTRAMMELSASIGAAHLIVANAIVAAHQPGLRRVAPIGWAVMIASSAGLYFGWTRTVEAALAPAIVGLALSACSIVLFSGVEQRPLARLALGVLGLARATAILADTLSYLRLFALGFAGSALAVVFNEMAVRAAHEIPGLGLIAAGLILVLGHGLNFVLGVAGGFVHGLRLNFIEFFNWSQLAEGRPFLAFRKREMTPSTL